MTELDKAVELSQAWDARNQGRASLIGDDELLGVIIGLETEFRLNSLSDGAANSIWANVMAGAVSGITAANIDASPVQASTPEIALAPFSSFVTRFAWVILAGLAGGFIAGIGSRLTMRLAGFLTIDRNRFILTENDARVGELTLDGTLTLGFMGAALGALALMLYVLIKDRLPYDGWKRAAVFSWLLLLVFGFVLMDPTNPDYRTFGPPWLNVITFCSLYLILGMSVVTVYESGRHWVAKRQGQFDRGRLGILKIAGATFVSGIGLIMLIPATFMGPSIFLIPLLAGLFWLASKVIGLLTDISYEPPVVFRQWGIWVVPGLIGFILTARGITDILMN